MSHRDRLAAAKARVAETQGKLLNALGEFNHQLPQEHQDDWDDTLIAADRLIQQARDAVRRATEVLIAGS